MTLRLSLKYQQIHVTFDEQFSSLHMMSGHLPVSRCWSPGWWSMVLLGNSVHSFWSCICAPLCVTRAPLWERLDLNSSSVFRLLTCSSVCSQTCSAEPSLPPVHVRLVQTSDLWLHWMLLTIAVAGCSGGSLKPACSWDRSVLPGALPQLLHDKTLLELPYVIVVVVLVWKCFGMHNLKARECGLEEIITCWCSSWRCALWWQQKYCNQKYCFGQLTFSLFKGEKNCIAFQWSVFLSEINSRFKSVETQGVWGAEVVSTWPSHLCSSLGVGVLLWGCALLCLAKETASIRQRSHPSDFLSWVQLAIQGVGRAMPAFKRLARLMSALWTFQRMLIKLSSS